MINVGNESLTDNLDNHITDNLDNRLITNTTETVPVNPTLWELTTGLVNVDDEAGLGVLDEMGDSIYSESSTISTVSSQTQWVPLSGEGYVINIGFENISDNLNNLLIDNSGNYLVTTSTYDIPKNATVWTPSGV